MWDKIGTVLEVRPDKLSYLLDIEGKLLIRARFMIRPLEGGVSSELIDQVQDQSEAHSAEEFLPSWSERLKNQSKCVDPLTKPPISGSIAASTGSTESRWHRKCGSNQRPTTFARMPADFCWPMYNGPASPPGHLPSSWLQSLLLLSLSAAGSGLRGSAAPSTATRSSSPPSPQPLSRSHLPPCLSVPSGLRPQTQMFRPSKLQSGSALPQVRQVFPGPICHPQGLCHPNSHFLSSLPLSMTMEWDNRDTRGFQAIPSLKSTSGEGRQSSIPVGQQSVTVPAVVQCQPARRSQTPVPVSASASRSSSRTRFSNVPSGSDSEGGPEEIVLRSIRKTPTKTRTSSVYAVE